MMWLGPFWVTESESTTTIHVVVAQNPNCRALVQGWKTAGAGVERLYLDCRPMQTTLCLRLGVRISDFRKLSYYSGIPLRSIAYEYVLR